MQFLLGISSASALVVLGFGSPIAAYVGLNFTVSRPLDQSTQSSFLLFKVPSKKVCVYNLYIYIDTNNIYIYMYMYI